jgi:hypothetical protein
MKELNLLVADNDYHSYDLPRAIGLTRDQLRDSEIELVHTVCDQRETISHLDHRKYDALLIDNDFGEGAQTLYRVRVIYSEGREDLPIAYVSAYNKEGLIRQHHRIIPGISTTSLVHPEEFERRNITLIQKKGRNVGKDVQLTNLAKNLHDFLLSLK